jgi:hypothetical protein
MRELGDVVAFRKHQPFPKLATRRVRSDVDVYISSHRIEIEFLSGAPNFAEDRYLSSLSAVQHCAESLIEDQPVFYLCIASPSINASKTPAIDLHL